MLRLTTVIYFTFATAAAAAGNPPIPLGGSVPDAVPASSGPGEQPRICRSMPVTGSLISRRKQCLTKAQWRYVDDAHETEARRLMMDNMGRPSCNDAATC